MGVLELQRLYTLVLDSDSTKFAAFESFWDLDYKINLLNSIRRSLKVKMIEARTSRHYQSLLEMIHPLEPEKS